MLYKPKGPCPNKPDPTVPTPPVVHLPTSPPLPPPPPAATMMPVVEVVVTTVAPVETTAAVTLPVSTQSGLITTVSAVETGRTFPVRSAFQPPTSVAPSHALQPRSVTVRGRIEQRGFVEMHFLAKSEMINSILMNVYEI